jgi:hypothetical protein
MLHRRPGSSPFAAAVSLPLLLAAALLVAPMPVKAFEADVHFGLTAWLARQAGFEAMQAQIIATGDQRVDSGDMPDIDLEALYACVNKDEISARRAGAHHYPASASVPGAPETRAVSPNSDAARKAALATLDVDPSQAAFRLLQFGEALHLLQDSWAHQGTPGVPRLGDAAFPCDDRLAWGHPEARGGPQSHRADLTLHWPEDTVAMARATYDLLMRYPAISGVQRNPRGWDEIRPELDAFITASSKTEKARWFAAHTLRDVSFLEGISLPDGTEAFVQRWPGRKLPPLTTELSQQHAVEPGLLDFFNRFFARWLGTEDFASLAAEFSAAPGSNGGAASATMPRDELVSRLTLWRLHDHGRIAELALRRESLTADERASIDGIARQIDALAHYAPLSSAYYPLLPYGDDVSPLLPFFVTTASPDAGPRQAIAIAKFRHAPYNIVGVIAQNIDAQWRVTSIVSTVDH